jgi:hypothetical protein
MTMNNLLKLLAGEWAGTGLGEYPTIASFEYLETLRFTLDETRPLLHYEQKTRRRNMGQTDFVPSHWETGFLSLLSDNQVEVANAQSGGRLEVLTGTIEPVPAGLVLHLQSSHFANDPRMQESSRTITVNGDRLHYTMHMQTNKVPHLALHLEATLERQ